jgi:mannose-6-phosphate isomerase-like protein (cupin superfamily)
MFKIDLLECTEFNAGDNTHLRELFNPLKDPLELGYSFAVARLKPNETSLLHRLKSTEVYFFLKGEGEMEVGEQKETVQQNRLVYVPPNTTQRLKNTGREDLVFICIVDPAWKPEEEEVIE